MTDVDNTERLVAPGLSTLVFDTLKNVIIQGEIKLVEHLSKSSLARRFGVNRGPLCEAIGQLECHRLVECKSNLGQGLIRFLIQI